MKLRRILTLLALVAATAVGVAGLSAPVYAASHTQGVADSEWCEKPLK
jgi:hypothetical protein